MRINRFGFVAELVRVLTLTDRSLTTFATQVLGRMPARLFSLFRKGAI